MRNPVEVLLVEDSAADVDLTREALAESKVIIHLSVVTDGEEAIRYLRREGAHAHALRPDVILLDLNLPKKDGREVLREIKQDRSLRSIPVVVLTTSDTESDILKSYNFGANCYITKPIGFSKFAEIVGSMGDFWFTIVKLPSHEVADHLLGATPPPGSRAFLRSRTKILLVEDNPGDADMISILLLDDYEKFEIAHVDRLSAALEYLNHESVDAILLDLGLPDCQGFETFRRVQDESQEIPIIILTGLDERDLAVKAMRLGAQEYVVKGKLGAHSLATIILYSIERKWAENERSLLLSRETEARADAERAARARDEFISIASHELRTPLTSLKMQLQLTRRMAEHCKAAAFSEGALQAMLKNSEQQVDRLGTLVNRLLDVSKINIGKLDLQRSECDLSQLVRWELESMREELERAKCPLILEVETPLVGNWDRFRVEQVVINLLSNALKYGAGKTIEIKTAREGDQATLTVQDHGIGIAKKDLDRIFTRFERLHPEMNVSGLGLGLYISRQIAMAHGGTIRAQSTLGDGSIFTLELPLKKVEQIAA